MDTRLPHGYKNLLRWLNRRNACEEGMVWVRENRFESLADLWDKCSRSDWMLWLLDEVDYQNDKDLRLFACACVRVIWASLIDERSRNAVEVAEHYAIGEATDEELAAAWDAAWAAAWAAARAAAGDAAGDAARAAAWDDAWDAAGAAQSDMLRDKIGNPFRGGHDGQTTEACARS